MRRVFLVLALVAGLWPGTAQASPIVLFTENFDLENGGKKFGELNYGNFAQFEVVEVNGAKGAVDLLPVEPDEATQGPGAPFNFLGQHAEAVCPQPPCFPLLAEWLKDNLYVDLDGSLRTPDPNDDPNKSLPGLLQLKNFIGVAPGSYSLKFMLAGNFRSDDAETVQVKIFSDTKTYLDTSITKNRFDFDPFQSLAFNVTDLDSIKFSFQNGGDDFRGALLDNIVLLQESVTEVPEPGSMILLATGLLYLGRRVQKRARA